jgi:hypothetical protein
MTAGLDQFFDIACVVILAVVSTGPPGGKGTMNVTALSGQVAWACAWVIPMEVTAAKTKAEMLKK